ncbi:hypothetical protein CVT24_001435 [Panaeolus cyanescens]|uniref:Uncharacterized protein n=1 Tax=Panaeolus cyanescens TaxID=181874 RepID=A0A409W3B3_9AGAR|nr:hypothetical protein CVT24_001435 [Panaeolus cyanescens]
MNQQAECSQLEQAQTPYQNTINQFAPGVPQVPYPYSGIPNMYNAQELTGIIPAPPQLPPVMNQHLCFVSNEQIRALSQGMSPAQVGISDEVAILLQTHPLLAGNPYIAPKVNVPPMNLQPQVPTNPRPKPVSSRAKPPQKVDKGKQRAMSPEQDSDQTMSTQKSPQSIAGSESSMSKPHKGPKEILQNQTLDDLLDQNPDPQIPASTPENPYHYISCGFLCNSKEHNWVKFGGQCHKKIWIPVNTVNDPDAENIMMVAFQRHLDRCPFHVNIPN